MLSIGEEFARIKGESLRQAILKQSKISRRAGKEDICLFFILFYFIWFWPLIFNLIFFIFSLMVVYIYFEHFNTSRLEDLRTMLEHEMWHKCPLAPEYTVFDVKEFRQALNRDILHSFT
jgi:hypothetical protein